jgi:hypothetical protein
MANIKITDLTAYGNPTSTDVLPIVDVGADVTKKVSIADLLENAGSGTEELPGISFDGDPDTGIYRPGANQVAISTNGTERLRIDSSGRVGWGGGGSSGALTWDTNQAIIRADASNELVFAANNAVEHARIDSSGRLLIGTSTTYDADAQLQTNGTISASFYRFGADDGRVYIGSARGMVASPTTLNSSDAIGSIYFRGHDGTSFKSGASIVAAIDGITPSSDLPTRLVFSVTANGASSPTEAMRIKNSRIINIAANTPVYADNAAAKTGGLVDGDVYRTSTGDLKIVYT